MFVDWNLLAKHFKKDFEEFHCVRLWFWFMVIDFKLSLNNRHFMIGLFRNINLCYAYDFFVLVFCFAQAKHTENRWFNSMVQVQVPGPGWLFLFLNQSSFFARLKLIHFWWGQGGGIIAILNRLLILFQPNARTFLTTVSARRALPCRPDCASFKAACALASRMPKKKREKKNEEKKNECYSTNKRIILFIVMPLIFNSFWMAHIWLLCDSRHEGQRLFHSGRFFGYCAGWHNQLEPECRLFFILTLFYVLSPFLSFSLSLSLSSVFVLDFFGHFFNVRSTRISTVGWRAFLKVSQCEIHWMSSRNRKIAWKREAREKKKRRGEDK